MKTDNLIEDSKLTKNELIDYVISKKVEEINEKLNVARTQRDNFRQTINAEHQVLRKKISDLNVKAISEYVKKSYGKIIKQMETDLKCKHVIITNETSRKSHIFDQIASMFRMKNTEVIVAFMNKVETHDESEPDFHGGRNRWRMHPMEMMEEMMFRSVGDLQSFFRIDISNVKDKKAETLEHAIKMNTDKDEHYTKIITDLQQEIQNVRGQRETIKNNLIEQTLNQSEDGKKLLETLNSIVIDKIKLLA